MYFLRSSWLVTFLMCPTLSFIKIEQSKTQMSAIVFFLLSSRAQNATLALFLVRSSAIYTDYGKSRLSWVNVSWPAPSPSLVSLAASGVAGSESNVAAQDFIFLRFFQATMTRAFVLRLTNFTMIALPHNHCLPFFRLGPFLGDLSHVMRDLDLL